MELRVAIDDRKFMFLLALLIGISAVGLVVAYGGTQPSVMGHTWGEVDCNPCIRTSNIFDSQITGAKIADGTITSADVSSIDGSRITGTVPYASSAGSAGNADTVDGYHASSFFITCPCGTCWSTTDTGCEGGVIMCTPSGWKTTGGHIGYCDWSGPGAD